MNRMAMMFSLMLVGCAPFESRGRPDLVDAAEWIPGLVTDIRYFGSNNFVGTPIDGYDAPKCLLQDHVAEALARVEADLRQHGQRLLVFDCYRPQRAVAHFMRWARDEADQRGKDRWFPNLDKSVLVPDYIAEQSGHSRADTIDVTLMQCADAKDVGTCTALDMGTEFDFFDVRANTDSDLVNAAQKTNRHRLREVMAQQGFVNYPMEWWHFTLPDPNRIPRFWNVPVR